MDTVGNSVPKHRPLVDIIGTLFTDIGTKFPTHVRY